jgi:hypothetical protein
MSIRKNNTPRQGRQSPRPQRQDSAPERTPEGAERFLDLPPLMDGYNRGYDSEGP